MTPTNRTALTFALLLVLAFCVGVLIGISWPPQPNDDGTPYGGARRRQARRKPCTENRYEPEAGTAPGKVLRVEPDIDSNAREGVGA